MLIEPYMADKMLSTDERECKLFSELVQPLVVDALPRGYLSDLLTHTASHRVRFNEVSKPLYPCSNSLGTILPHNWSNLVIQG